MQNMQNMQNMENFFSTHKCFPSPNIFSLSFSVLYLINQNVIKTKVQCPHSNSRTCLAQEFGLVYNYQPFYICHEWYKVMTKVVLWCWWRFSEWLQSIFCTRNALAEDQEGLEEIANKVMGASVNSTITITNFYYQHQSPPTSASTTFHLKSKRINMTNSIQQLLFSTLHQQQHH